MAETPEIKVVTCPFCKEEIKEGATICPHCRSAVSKEGIAQKAVNQKFINDLILFGSILCLAILALFLCHLFS